MGKAKKTLADQVQEVSSHLPSTEDLLALKDQLVEKVPDKSELLDLRDDLLDKLPDTVSEALPVEKKKGGALRTVGKVALFGAIAAAIGGAIAFTRAKLADRQSVPPYTSPPPAGGAPRRD